MRTVCLSLALCGLITVGCGGGSVKLDLAVEFPDETAREQSATVRVVVILPGVGAVCESLVDGTSEPGQEAYPVEDELTIVLPATESDRRLELDEPGQRLFFAEASDAVGEAILRGCTAIDVDPALETEVVIALQWLSNPCTQDSECDDSDECTDDRCQTGECENTPVTDGAACSDDSNPCTTDECQAGICLHDPVADGTACSDGEWCNGDETCSGGVCGTGQRDCDDGDLCTQNLCDDVLDSCQNPPVTIPPGPEGPVGDPTCGDSVDNDCDGLTDAADPECITCTTDADCDDGNSCTNDSCDGVNCTNLPVADGTGCADGTFCTEPDSCTGGLCSGPQRDCSGLDDACNLGVCDEGAGACAAQPKALGEVCDDGLFCTDGDSCDGAGACTSGAQSPCVTECLDGCDDGTDSCTPTASGTACTDDGLYCNGVEECDGAGACAPSGDPCGSAQCSTCDEGSDQCNVQGGLPCDDGVDCTGTDTCDGTGACAGTPDNAFCDALNPGDLCLPSCSGSADGCGTPPANLALVCTSPVDLAATDTSDCTLSLTGGDSIGQESCLSCSAEIGLFTIGIDGFDACGQDGWSLVSGAGNNCRARVNGCSLGGGPRSCCDNFATICDQTTFGQPVLRSLREVNCGGAVSQWRIVKTFDLDGLTDLSLCYSAADNGASADSGIQVYVEDSSNSFTQVDCFNGGPQPNVDDRFFRRCVSLPGWASGSTDLMVTFIVHSDVAGEAVYLDNLELSGWAGGCVPDTVQVFADQFTACDDSAWTFSGGAQACVPAGCTNEPTWQPGIVAGATPVSMETTVDTTELDGAVDVCFRAGSSMAGPLDTLTLWFDTGMGPQTAWSQAGGIVVDGECFEHCVDLASVDLAVRNNPALTIGFDLDGDTTIGLYGVTVSGTRHCAAGVGQISLSTPLNGDGSGNYDFAATDVTGLVLSTQVGCVWDPDPVRAGTTEIEYR